MTPWRIGRGWSKAELRSQLAGLGDRTVSVATRPGDAVAAPGDRTDGRLTAPLLAPVPGWTVERRETVLGYEAPGPPHAGGLFERAQQALREYRFADPRITRGFFDPQSPLLGRTILVDVHAVLLRFLVGLRVGAVVDRTGAVPGDERTGFGVRLDTLQGHLLHGLEWVLVVKEHQSGAVRLRIEARWRPAPLPAWWMGLGFRLFGRQIQARWRRQVARRLRALA